MAPVAVMRGPVTVQADGSRGRRITANLAGWSIRGLVCAAPRDHPRSECEAEEHTGQRPRWALATLRRSLEMRNANRQGSRGESANG